MSEAERGELAKAWEKGYLAGHFSALAPNERTPENPYDRSS